MAPSALRLLVRQISIEAKDINSYELVDANGNDLPEFNAGSHIDVHLPGGLIRQYSLCNAPHERHRYCIAVLKDSKSTGGSIAMHESVHAGQVIAVSYPRCNFRLAEKARFHLLLAGGIGVTPFMSMIERLESTGERFVMHYCSRSEEHTAFRNRLTRLVATGKVKNHYDGGDPSKGLDIGQLLAAPEEGMHLYYCGPAGFMRAVRNASAHWPEETVHCEYFAPPPGEDLSRADGPAEFHIQIGRGGEIYPVPPAKSIVQVLREHSRHVDTSCESGTCGTCKTRYLEGEPLHNDYVLTNSERREWVMICCARSKSRLLVLDLPSLQT